MFFLVYLVVISYLMAKRCNDCVMGIIWDFQPYSSSCRSLNSKLQYSRAHDVDITSRTFEQKNNKIK